jgi:hypothetical protein
MVWLEDKRKLCQSQCTPNRRKKVKEGQTGVSLAGRPLFQISGE